MWKMDNKKEKVFQYQNQNSTKLKNSLKKFHLVVLNKQT